MRPWLLVSGDFVKTGGMDRANFALADFLARSGEEVHLVAHRADPELLARANVTLHLAPKPLNSYYLGRLWIDRLGRKWARRIARRNGRVVVNGGNCLWGDVNWVHYVHAAYEPRLSGGVVRQALHAWKRRAFLREEHRALTTARIVIANSQRTRRDLVERLSLDDSRIAITYYGTDPSSFRCATTVERAQTRAALNLPVDRSIALFVGALGDRRKAFDTVFDAWRLLRAGMPNWDCLLAVVGQGAEVPAWQERAAAAGLADQIRFLGFRSDVPQIVRAVDVMVAPARYEAYGLAVHEALCSGVPAVVSACSGVCERYPAELRDLLVQDPGDPAELAGRLQRWLAARTAIRATMLGISQSLRQWTWDHMAQEMVRRIMESAPAPAATAPLRMSA